METARLDLANHPRNQNFNLLCRWTGQLTIQAALLVDVAMFRLRRKKCVSLWMQIVMIAFCKLNGKLKGAK
jgi:hypothetical protein